VGELSPPDAAYELYASNVVRRPATNKEIRQKFLCIIGRLWARQADAPKGLVPCCLSSAQALQPSRRARLFRRYPNEQGGVAFWFP
jgi:hypothetical protein